jgi:DNA-binding ferritin-like protein (Dps family)
MSGIIKTIFGDKKEWHAMEARAKALPEEYRFVYRKIQHYMWNYSAGSGMDMTGIFKDLLGLFEEGAAEGKSVLEITGEDVASFCDDLLRNARTYTENWREALNRDIQKKLGKGNDSK